MKKRLSAHIAYMSTLVFTLFFSVAFTAIAVTYDSCLDAYESGETESGRYDIDGLNDAYCEMEVNGGGWLRITPEVARDDLDGTIIFEDGRSNTDYGFDSSDRPYTRDDSGAHTAHYTFDLPTRMTQFFLQDYYARSNSAYDDSSDIYESRFRQRDWDEAHDQSVGDISFGFADDRGPVTSFAKELNDDVLVQQYQSIAWPEDEQVFETNSSSDQFRIGWGDEGAPSEGWFPWWSGYILVRERDADKPRDDIKIQIQDVNIETDNDVEFRTRVSGDPQDEDAKIRVEYEDNENGNCRGDWERAEIKSGATATNEDGNNEPSVDNGDSYQIGSTRRERVIADGSNNTVKFKWNAEKDLGNNPEGEYCVRVTVRSDSGESDTDTYKVNFSNITTPIPIPQPTGGVHINLPHNGATVTNNNVAIIGAGVAGQRVTVEAVGKSCSAVVMSSGGWTCTLTLLPAGTYTVVATQRNNYGQITGTATSGFTILGKQCPVFSQYHKLGQSGGEIPQIQEFLKSQGYYRGFVSGYYDFATDQAIRSFQLEFRELILDPWRLPAPTGNWYKTTRKHANFLSGCYETVYLEDIGITY